MEIKRFLIGKVYDSVCWFSGGTAKYEVISNDGDYVEFKVRGHELDGDM